MALNILTDVENKLLERREVKCVFQGLSGKLTRQDAARAVAAQLKVDAKHVHLIRLSTSQGSRNIEGLMYVYRSEENAKTHLPPYLFVRQLLKEERTKAREAKAKPAVKTEAKAEAKPSAPPRKE